MLTDRKPEPQKRTIIRSCVVEEIETIKIKNGEKLVIRKTPTVNDIPVAWLMPDNENFNGEDTRDDD